MDGKKQTAVNPISKGRPGPGRPKGVPNKQTTLLKDAILQAATNLGGEDGLVGYLENLARTNDSAFATLVGKVLPMQVQGDFNVTSMTKDQRDAAVAAAARADS